MTLALKYAARSICWSCVFWEFVFRMAGNPGVIDICSHPAGYMATDDKIECDAYQEERRK